MSLYVLLLALPAAALAYELSIEGFESFSLRFELVRVAFNCLEGELGVHLMKQHHSMVDSLT